MTLTIKLEREGNEPIVRTTTFTFASLEAFPLEELIKTAFELFIEDSMEEDSQQKYKNMRHN